MACPSSSRMRRTPACRYTTTSALLIPPLRPGGTVLGSHATWTRRAADAGNGVSLALLAAALNWFFLRGNLREESGHLGRRRSRSWRPGWRRPRVPPPRAVKTAAWTMTVLVLIPDALSNIARLERVARAGHDGVFGTASSRLGGASSAVTTELAALPSRVRCFAARAKRGRLPPRLHEPTIACCVIADAAEIPGDGRAAVCRRARFTIRPGLLHAWNANQQ